MKIQGALRRAVRAMRNTRSNMIVVLWRRRGVTIGDHVEIPVGSRLSGSTRIGTGTRFHGPPNIRGTGTAVFGRYCAIGEELLVLTSNHALRSHLNLQIALQRRVTGVRVDAQDRVGVSIGNGAWIGDRAIVLPGVEIGPGAAVGAGSIVTQNVSAFSVVAGAPARVLAPRFPPDVCATMLALNWWEWPEDRMRRNHRLFETDIAGLSADEIKALVVD